MMEFVKKILSNSKLMFFLLAAISAVALVAAFIAEYAFGLLPCILCLYQRIPYAVAIGLGLIGLMVAGKCSKAAPVLFSLLGLTFLVNSVIAFYHTGVERGWWPSHLEGCTVPELQGNITDVLAQIQASTEAVRCDEIPWADPVLGLSMANYNVLMCMGLAVAAFLAAFLSCRQNKNNT